MKRKLILLIATVATACAVMLSSCATDQTGSLATFWNSPAVQSELTLIQNAAFAFINGYLNKAGGMRAMSRSSGGINSAAVDACVADLHDKFPGVPDTVLRGAAVKAAQGR